MTTKPNRAQLSAVFHRIAATQEGFASAMSKASGVFCSQQSINNWLKRENVPATWVPFIVKAGDGKIAAHEIRPDIFPAPE